MSELNPRSAKTGDTYHSALGLRLLPEGAVIRNGPRTHPLRFRKIGADAWAYADADGYPTRVQGDLGTSRLPFRSEQIWLPAILERINIPAQVAAR